MCGARFRLPSIFGMLAVFALLASPSSGSAQQVACWGSPNPDAPAGAADYQFLIGRFDVRGRQWTGEDWGPQGPLSYWEGEYILGGYAVADYYYNVPPEQGETGRGVNVRMFNPETNIWTMTWIHTRAPGTVLQLESEYRDGVMWMYQMDDPETRFDGRKTSFHVVDQDNWYRVDEYSADGGRTWTKRLKLEATRRPC